MYKPKPNSPITRIPSPAHLPGDEKILTVYNSDFSPGITGYTFGIFGRFSSTLGHTLFGTSGSVSLATLARGFTTPNVSISEVSYKGYQDKILPGKVSIGNDLSVKFLDTSDEALSSFFKLWVNIIRPLDGVTKKIHSKMTRKISGGIYKLEYFGSLVVFTTDPTISVVNSCAGFVDIWPTNYPMESLNTEISGNDALYITQNFKVNRFIPQSKGLKEFIQNKYLPYYKSLEHLN